MGQSGRRAAVVGVVIIMVAVVMAILPRGPATLDAVAGVLRVRIVELLILIIILGYIPWWLRRRQ